MTDVFCRGITVCTVSNCARLMSRLYCIRFCAKSYEIVGLVYGVRSSAWCSMQYARQTSGGTKSRCSYSHSRRFPAITHFMTAITNFIVPIYGPIVSGGGGGMRVTPEPYEASIKKLYDITFQAARDRAVGRTSGLKGFRNCEKNGSQFTTLSSPPQVSPYHPRTNTIQGRLL